MILGVPTLNRYDLLDRLIASAEAGSLKPSAYLIVDNGRRLNEEAPKMAGVAAAIARGAPFIVLTPDTNLGVAASWNAMLDQAGAALLVISNDDVELGENALEQLCQATLSHEFVHVGGWCLFSQTRECTDLVGPYDENFFPAYYEDSDYEQRLRVAGVEVHHEPVNLKHQGWATTSAGVPENILAAPEKNAELFRAKWGGMPGENLSLDPSWPELKQNPLHTEWRMYVEQIMRWDVINHVAKIIGATDYLEIGVSSGESMRNVNIGTKVGVDPDPQLDGVRACDVFIPKSSDELFEKYDESGQPDGTRFDIVFVDGLHHAAQAYRDIMNSARIAKVVIVHDANPSTEEMQRVPQVPGMWTGDTWKAVAQVRAEGKHLVRTVDTDYGVAIVIPNRGEGAVEGSPRETWEDLQEHRQNLLGLVSVSDWKSWFEEVIKCS